MHADLQSGGRYSTRDLTHIDCRDCRIAENERHFHDLSDPEWLARKKVKGGKGKSSYADIIRSEYFRSLKDGWLKHGMKPEISLEVVLSETNYEFWKGHEFPYKSARLTPFAPVVSGSSAQIKWANDIQAKAKVILSSELQMLEQAGENEARRLVKTFSPVILSTHATDWIKSRFLLNSRTGFYA